MKPNERKSEIILLRLTKAERERLEHKAEEAGVKVSKYIRQLLHEKGV